MDEETSPNAKPDWPRRMLYLGLLMVVSAVGFSELHKARNTAAKNSCNGNLKQIDAAVQQWALENKKSATDTYSLSDPAILACMRGSALPECPGGGRYLRGSHVSASPHCTIRSADHSL